MNYGKIFQSVVSTVIQSYVFYKSKRLINSYECNALLIITIFSSLVVFMMTAFEILFQSSHANSNNSSNHNNNSSINENKIIVENVNPLNVKRIGEEVNDSIL